MRRAMRKVLRCITDVDEESAHDREGEEYYLSCDAANRVFGNELLLDKILKFAIHDGERVDTRTANACKLVNSVWLDRVLEHVQFSVVNLNTDNDAKVTDFIDTFGYTPITRIVPFHLTICPSMRDTDYKSTLRTIRECLTRCGSGLVRLDISCFDERWKVERRSFTNPPIPLSLPNLKQLSVHQISFHPNDRKRYRHFVQTILSSSERLHSLFLYGDGFHTERNFAINVKRLSLPQSLRKVHFQANSGRWAHHLDYLLLKNGQLPYLTTLSLQICGSDEFDLKRKLFPVLNAYRHHLRTLDVSNSLYETSASIQVPVMTSLEELICGAWYCERPNKSAPIIRTFFPSLEKFQYKSYETDTLLQWIPRNEKSVSVKEVNVELLAENESGDGNLKNKLCRLNSAFSNITKLTVLLPFKPDIYALNNIFKAMHKLQELNITFTSCPSNMSTAIFNALLLGITKKEALALEQQGRNFHEIDFHFEERSSIRNLSRLRKFHMYGVGECAHTCYLDVAVKFGLSRMPNIDDFEFGGVFDLRATDEEVYEWKKQVLRRNVFNSE